MDNLWKLLKKIRKSETTYESKFSGMSSKGSFKVLVEEKDDKIYFSEKGKVKIDNNIYDANNYVYWRQTNDTIEFHRRRIAGYEKLFEIDTEGNSINLHT